MNKTKRIFLAAVVFLPLFFCNAVPTLADEITDGRQALESANNFPWYDEANDSFKAIPLEKSVAPGSVHRETDWVKPTKQPTTPRGGGWGGFSGFGGFSGISVMFWVVVGLILVAAICALLWAFLKVEGDEGDRETQKTIARHQSDAERIENLPFEVRKGTGSMYDEAKLAYESGNYREATIYLFSHMLLQMDREHWIRLAKAKTNGQYLAEVRSNKQLKTLFHRTTLAFEDVFFGHRNIDKGRFESCWNSLADFDSAIKQSSPEGAL